MPIEGWDGQTFNHSRIIFFFFHCGTERVCAPRIYFFFYDGLSVKGPISKS